MASLTEQQIKKYSFQFLLFDRDSDDLISTADVGTLVRSLGTYPTNADVASLSEQLDPEHRGYVSKEDFLRVMANYVASGGGLETEEDLRGAFRVFDRDLVGFLSSAEFRHILTNLGEKLTEEQVDALMAEVEVDHEGMINYEELIRVALSVDEKEAE